jgi:hypothetical protein
VGGGGSSVTGEVLGSGLSAAHAIFTPRSDLGGGLLIFVTDARNPCNAVSQNGNVASTSGLRVVLRDYDAELRGQDTTVGTYKLSSDTTPVPGRVGTAAFWRLDSTCTNVLTGSQSGDIDTGTLDLTALSSSELTADFSFKMGLQGDMLEGTLRAMACPGLDTFVEATQHNCIK